MRKSPESIRAAYVFCHFSVMKMKLALHQDPFSQSVNSGCQFHPHPVDWNDINEELCSIIDPIHFRLCSDDISTDEAGELFSGLLTDLLLGRGILKRPHHSKITVHTDKEPSSD